MVHNKNVTVSSSQFLLFWWHHQRSIHMSIISRSKTFLSFLSHFFFFFCCWQHQNSLKSSNIPFEQIYVNICSTSFFFCFFVSSFTIFVYSWYFSPPDLRLILLFFFFFPKVHFGQVYLHTMKFSWVTCMSVHSMGVRNLFSFSFLNCHLSLDH